LEKEQSEKQEERIAYYNLEFLKLESLIAELNNASDEEVYFCNYTFLFANKIDFHYFYRLQPRRLKKMTLLKRFEANLR
jgi:hypothetical protein